MKIRRTIPPVAAPIPLRVWLHGIYGMLDKNIIKKMEMEFKEYFGTEHVFFVSSGKAALLLILLALKSFSDRKKVIIPAYTCYSVPSAVVKAGLTVVPCDIRPETLDFEWDKLATLLDVDTLCVIPTHLFGIPSDVDRIRDICKGRGVYIIEDASQAMGSKVGEKKLGSLGDVSFFSLGRGKNITCGSGGIIVTDSEVTAEAVRKIYKTLKRESVVDSIVDVITVFMLSIFINPCLYWFPHGLPILKLGETKFYKDFSVFRFSGFKAGLLRYWRESLGAYNHVRSATGEYYLKELKLEKTLPIYSCSVPYLRFPVYVKDDLFKSDAYKDYRFLGVTRMYPDSINNIKEIHGDFNSQKYENSEKIAKSLLTLPTHSLLRHQDKANICHIIRHLLKVGVACE